MGCSLSEEYDTDSDEEREKLNEIKSQDELWSELPALQFIDTKIEKLFQIQKVLGKGGSCRVLRVNKKSTNKRYAMKEMIRNDDWNPILFQQEIKILSTISVHPNILKYCESYVHHKYLYICTNLCTGGELFDKIKTMKHFSEKHAAEVLRSILEALMFVHSKNIVHRDLKPENMVYENNSPDSPLIIIDFGDASPIKSEYQIFSDFVGTPFYIAPESIRHRAGWELYKSDMWAIGVIAFVLLTGRPPFWGVNNREILKKITRATVVWPKSVNLSASSKSFVLSLLQRDCRLRLSAKDALRHPWIVSEAYLHNEHLGSDVIRNIRKFQNACKLKKLIVTKMVEELSDSEKQSIAEAFSQLDINGDGFVDHEELCIYLRNTGLSEKESGIRSQELIHTMDKDGDGKIDLNEWITAKTVDNLAGSLELIRLQFEKIANIKLFDEISDNENDDDIVPAMKRPKTISTQQIKDSFSHLLDDEDLDDIVNEVDVDGDGLITLEEFQKAMQQFTTRRC